ncbi:MAG TPA: RNA-binding protein [Deltaproteobacteria bacterium]|nr:RNA-binding protein [Deltaproteobacteria bacterium]
MANTKLFVGNLSYSIDKEQLRELFSQFGEVQNVNVIERRGFGFVEMTTQEEAEKAKKTLNGTEFKGRTLKVDTARSERGREGQRRGPRRY